MFKKITALFHNGKEQKFLLRSWVFSLSSRNVSEKADEDSFFAVQKYSPYMVSSASLHPFIEIKQGNMMAILN